MTDSPIDIILDEYEEVLERIYLEKEEYKDEDLRHIAANELAEIEDSDTKQYLGSK